MLVSAQYAGEPPRVITPIPPSSYPGLTHAAFNVQTLAGLQLVPHATFGPGRYQTVATVVPSGQTNTVVQTAIYDATTADDLRVAVLDGSAPVQTVLDTAATRHQISTCLLHVSGPARQVGSPDLAVLLVGEKGNAGLNLAPIAAGLLHLGNPASVRWR